MKIIRFFLFENSQFLEVKFSIHLNRRVFVMERSYKIYIHIFIMYRRSTKVKIIGAKV